MAKREIERLNRGEIRSYQGKELAVLLEYVGKNSRFYIEHFKENKIKTDKIKSLDDLINIPPTKKEHLQKRYSDFVCVKPAKIIEYLTTSGTAGDPVTYAMTENDLKRLAYNEYLGFSCAGCTSKEIFQLMTTIDRRFIAGMAYWLGSRRLKSAMIRVGNGIPELQWDTIKRFSPTTLIAVPSFLLNI